MNEIQAVLAILESTPVLLRSSLEALPDPLRKRRLREDQWSAHETAVHLASIQPVFVARLERMLAEENPRLDSWAPVPEDVRGVFLEEDLAQALDRFERERGDLLALLRSLPAEAWARTADHPDYDEFSILTMFRHLAVHDGLRLCRIEQFRVKRKGAEGAAPELPAPPPPVSAAAGLRGVLSRLVPGQVNVLGPFEVPGFKPRYVRVYLPHGYTPERTWMGLYLFDGQNLFGDEGTFSGGWHVHKAVEGLARTHRPVPVVIGIDHGAEERIDELNPFTLEGTPGRLPAFAAWITGTLMPVLGAELHLVEPPFGAVIGGSSMGGLAALWTHFHHPRSFSGAMAMSPSIWIDHQKIFEDLAAQPEPELSRIYLDAGAKENRGMFLPLVASLAHQLTGRGWDRDQLLWRPDARGLHNEASWRRRLPKALRFLYGRG